MKASLLDTRQVTSGFINFVLSLHLHSMIPDNYSSLPGFRTVYNEGELRQAIAVIECLLINNVVVPNLNGVIRTPSIERVSNSGIVASGAKTVLVSNNGNASGILLGVEFLPLDTISLEATDLDTIGEISYDATGTIFTIITLR